MADVYRMTTGQRVYLFAVVAAYFAFEFLPGVPNASVLQDVASTALALPIGLVIVHRATSTEPTDRVALVGGGGFLLAGLVYAYRVLVAVVGVPSVPALALLGPLAMLVGLAVYVYQT